MSGRFFAEGVYNPFDPAVIRQLRSKNRRARRMAFLSRLNVRFKWKRPGISGLRLDLKPTHPDSLPNLYESQSTVYFGFLSIWTYLEWRNHNGRFGGLTIRTRQLWRRRPRATKLMTKAAPSPTWYMGVKEFHEGDCRGNKWLVPINRVLDLNRP